MMRWSQIELHLHLNVKTVTRLIYERHARSRVARAHNLSEHVGPEISERKLSHVSREG